MATSPTPHRVARRKANRLDRYGVLKITVPLDEIFAEAADLDEATLESADGDYRETVNVGEQGKRIDQEHVELTFRGVAPGKRYTLTYATKLDAEDREDLSLVIFSSRLVRLEDMKKGIKKEIPMHNEEDEDDESPPAET